MYYQSATGELKTNAALKCHRVNFLIPSVQQAQLKLILVLCDAKLHAFTPVTMPVRRTEDEDKKLCAVGITRAGIGRKQAVFIQAFKLFELTRGNHACPTIREADNQIWTRSQKLRGLKAQRCKQSCSLKLRGGSA